MLTRALAIGVLIAGCDERRSQRADAIAAILTESDGEFIAARPSLVRGKYETMAGSAFAYFRGSLPIFAADRRQALFGLAASSTMLSHVIVRGLGDPHYENFGLLLNADAHLALEPNDFDAADAVPCLWDFRRLSTSLLLAASVSALDASVRDADVMESLVAGYAQGLTDTLGGNRKRVDRPSDGNRILADLWERAEEDLASKAEFTELTSGGRLVRGVLDADEPTQFTRDLPEGLRAHVEQALEQYRHSLGSGAEPLELVDVVQEVGAGVASWPRLRLLVLARQDDGSQLILEMKEILDAKIGHWHRPHPQHMSVGDRVLSAAHLSWATPSAEPWWGVTELWGFPMQARAEREAHKSLRVERLRDSDAQDFVEVGGILGYILGRTHASADVGLLPPPGSLIEEALNTREERASFAAEETTIASQYVQQVLEDYDAFRDLVATRGSLLGATSRSPVANPELRALFEIGASP